MRRSSSGVTRVDARGFRAEGRVEIDRLVAAIEPTSRMHPDDDGNSVVLEHAGADEAGWAAVATLARHCGGFEISRGPTSLRMGSDWADLTVDGSSSRLRDPDRNAALNTVQGLISTRSFSIRISGASMSLRTAALQLPQRATPSARCAPRSRFARGCRGRPRRSSSVTSARVDLRARSPRLALRQAVHPSPARPVFRAQPVGVVGRDRSRVASRLSGSRVAALSGGRTVVRRPASTSPAGAAGLLSARRAGRA